MFSFATSYRVLVLTFFAVSLSIVASTAHAAKDPIYTKRFSNLAVSGYDTVAYFTQSEALKGDEQFATEWMGAEWRFSSIENLNAFIEAPEKYAPQYGGYCAYAASANRAVSADPKQWTIHNDKLYLNYNKKVKEEWLQNPDAYIANADKNWPGLLE